MPREARSIHPENYSIEISHSRSLQTLMVSPLLCVKPPVFAQGETFSFRTPLGSSARGSSALEAGVDANCSGGLLLRQAFHGTEGYRITQGLDRGDAVLPVCARLASHRIG